MLQLLRVDFQFDGYAFDREITEQEGLFHLLHTNNRTR